MLAILTIGFWSAVAFFVLYGTWGLTECTLSRIPRELGLPGWIILGLSALFIGLGTCAL